jgi:hypothetical protein
MQMARHWRKQSLWHSCLPLVGKYQLIDIRVSVVGKINKEAGTLRPRTALRLSIIFSI